jgi:L-alanine-DL-glutamate epimerase-like enolase superfamily enzyme
VDADRGASSSNRVERIEVARRTIRLPERIASGIHVIDSIECVLVSLQSGDETGCGYAFCFSDGEAASIEFLARELASSVEDQPVHLVRQIWGELWRRTNFIGHAGPPLMALSSFDMALWDLLARTAGLPLYRALGAVRDQVRVYYAGGWLTLGVDELCAQAVDAKDAGFPAYKMRLGGPDWRVDVTRVKAVREAIGDEMLLMVDVNQAWDVRTAITAGRRLEEFELAWIEEPVDVHDVAGCARVAAAVDVPIAGGETVWGPHGLLELVRAGAVAILQPDLMRCGGITGFLAAAHVAEASGLSVVSHLYTPISAQLMATVFSSDLVEYIPGWFDALFESGPVIRRGAIELGDSPGTGVVFAADGPSR